MTASISKTRTPRAMTFARSQAGFNLIELMIVVAIIGILTGLAYTSYTDSVIKSRRKAATGCMNEVGQFMERFYTTNLTYAGAPPALLLAPVQCQRDLAAFYTVTPAATARAYTTTATPTIKQKDPKCNILTVTQTGAKTKSGTATIAECFP